MHFSLLITFLFVLATIANFGPYSNTFAQLPCIEDKDMESGCLDHPEVAGDPLTVYGPGSSPEEDGELPEVAGDPLTVYGPPSDPVPISPDINSPGGGGSTFCDPQTQSCPGGVDLCTAQPTDAQVNQCEEECYMNGAVIATGCLMAAEVPPLAAGCGIAGGLITQRCMSECDDKFQYPCGEEPIPRGRGYEYGEDFPKFPDIIQPDD